MHCFWQGGPPKGNEKGLSVNSLVPTRKFQAGFLKVTVLWGLKLQLGVKFGFADVGP